MSDQPTRNSTLDQLPVGCRAVVVSVERETGRRLAGHGIRPGITVTVESDAPFRGPRVVRVGEARIALARVIARLIVVERTDAKATAR